MSRFQCNRDPVNIKQKIGQAAAELVESGMIVGLGTGSTAHHFIESLALRCKKGLRITAVASSKASEELAKKLGIPLVDINTLTSLDLAIDGADEIDPQKRMIKGAGGALVREKIVAHMSREMIVIAEESKLVRELGSKGKLPLEIVPFAHTATLHQIAKLGYSATLRLGPHKEPYLTDNGNIIADISLPSPLEDPEKVHHTLLELPGVVDTGLFFHLAGRLVIGFRDGQVIIRS